MQGLETVYSEHHKTRGERFSVLTKERGAFLKQHVGEGKKVLDIGCRDGELTSQYNAGNMVTGADVDSAALALARERLGIETVHADLNGEWPFPHDTYDVVVACEFLEHVYFPDRVLEKIHAVLKDGGILVGTIPHAYSVQSRIKFLLGTKEGTPLQDPTHINQFSYREFKQLLEKHFIVEDFVGITPARYRAFTRVAPFAFAHDLMFCVRKRSKK